MDNEFVVPKRVQTETIFGCNASCVMCQVDAPTSRRKGHMPFEMFQRIVDQMAPFKDQMEKVDLFGIGEPLLDKTIFEKIAYAKAAGLPSVAISTNADLLSEDKAQALLDAGLDVVIFSIDGTDAATHEAIRVGVKYDRVVANARAMVALRDRQDRATRFVFRFVRQDSNVDQWDGFRALWGPVARPEKGDLIICYDVQSWGGKVGTMQSVQLPEVPAELPCHHLWDRLLILRDGTVALCCADIHEPAFDLGNVAQFSPLEIYNGPKFNALREMHRQGRRLDIDLCRNCTILESEAAQKIIT